MNNRIIYIGLGMVAGGIGGYLLADLIAWKILEEQFEQGLSEETEEKGEELFVGLRNEMDGIHEKGHVDYSQFAKEELKTLVEPYETETGPYIIAFDEFQENMLEDFEKVVISYYEDDGVYADPAEDSIAHPNDLFGPNIHLHFGEESEDPDVVYVANEEKGIIYEIVRIHDSYRVQVLGEEPKKKRGRPRKNPVESDENTD